MKSAVYFWFNGITLEVLQCMLYYTHRRDATEPKGRVGKPVFCPPYGVRELALWGKTSHTLFILGTLFKAYTALIIAPRWSLPMQ